MVFNLPPIASFFTQLFMILESHMQSTRISSSLMWHFFNFLQVELSEYVYLQIITHQPHFRTEL